LKGGSQGKKPAEKSLQSIRVGGICGDDVGFLSLF
jgi:hypothetical protein